MTAGSLKDCKIALHRLLYYGGRWQQPFAERRMPVTNPATGESLGEVVDADARDVDAAVAAAHEGFAVWRAMPPRERASILRRCAQRLREHARDLALIDATDAGLPLRAMLGDVEGGAAQLEYFAGLVTEIKGETIPFGPDSLNYTVREPLGVVVRINAFNHPLMFAAGKVAAPLAAGNAVIVKPANQTPLSTLALAEIWSDLLPPGVFNVVTGSRRTGAALVAHRGVAKVGLIGNVATGHAVMAASASTLKKLTLELGGKNALIGFADADPASVASAAVFGMNLKWTAGQSCGSTSRVFLHASIHDEVVQRIVEEMKAIRLGLPTDPNCEMGCLVSREQFDKALSYIQAGLSEGATLALGGSRPAQPALANGYFISPTVFTGVTTDMRIAREEIFGPVVSILKWDDEEAMLKAVNELDYGLTASIWTTDLARAHDMANRIQAGYVWVNGVSSHFLGAPFGGYKQSGLGREECLEELFLNSQLKNVNVNIAAARAMRTARET